MMVKIPLEAVPNQQVSVALGGQNCVLRVYQRGRYLYLDLTVDGTPVRQGSICLTAQLATGFLVKGFSGMLFFVDLEGRGGVPVWNEIGSRYVLMYAGEDEINV